jgi:hypothetical protein
MLRRTDNEDMRYGHKTLVGKSDWKRPLEKRRRRWENDIKWNFKKLYV